MKRILDHLTRAQLIALSFLILIALGTALLMLPCAARSGRPTALVDALFTAGSATCVTGLVVFDTFTHWTLFGQIVILSLIQIGGLGCMTIITLLAMFMRKKISLQSRTLLVQSAGSLRLAGVLRLIRRIAVGTFAVEFAGAAILATQFVPRFGWSRGIWASIFHAVSAFCNAGFDIMGRLRPGSSLVLFADNPTVILTIGALIVLGGLGFLVWSDLIQCRFRWHLCQVHTKLVLLTTGTLILLGWVLFFLFERNAAFAGFPLGKQVLSALFQSITPRTAGFNSVEMRALSEPGTALTIVLMFIGGSPGSTAGGIKTTTLAVLVVNAISAARGRADTTVLRSRVDGDTLRQASAIVMIYIAMVLTAQLAICALEPMASEDVLFEVVSAIGTVGLTKGITPMLGAGSKLILTLLMYAGRIGGLGFAMTLSERREQPPISRPAGKILVG